MVTISEYLENVYIDFAGDIGTETKLCELKGLNFEAGYLPDYENIQIQRLYLLRYSLAYGFEYSSIYSEALARLHNPQKVHVASIGCGNYLDYWSLVQAIEKKHIECEIRYVGIDEIDWQYKFAKRERDELFFKKGNAIKYFKDNNEFISDIYFFPKSISEFDADEMSVIVNNLQSKPILKNKLILCFSLRADEGSRERDMTKTGQIIEAIEKNGFHLNTPKDKCWCFIENRGIAHFDGKDCVKYLNRRPTLKTGYIYYQVIELERT